MNTSPSKSLSSIINEHAGALTLSTIFLGGAIWLGSLHQSIQDIRVRISVIEQRISGMDQRIGAVEQRLSSIEAKLDLLLSRPIN